MSAALINRGRRWFSASAVLFVVLCAGTIPPMLSDRPDAVARGVYFVLEAPLVFVALSLHYERAVKRQLGTTRMLFEAIGVAVVFGMLSASLFLALVGPIPGRHGHVWATLLFGALSGIVECAIWALGFVFPFAAADERLRAAEAERLRTAAELAQLRAQIEPHFLLNTLHAIAGLVTRQPKEARRLLGCLGDLLRDSLHDTDEMQTLDAEMTWLHRYAEILESRHSGALRFTWDIAPEARDVKVPRLLLQPLVENAVKHGALMRPGEGGEVCVRVSVDDDRQLICAIEDNGPGMPTKEARSGAFGIRSVRRRLELKYPDASLELESTAEGTRALVRLPS